MSRAHGGCLWMFMIVAREECQSGRERLLIGKIDRRIDSGLGT